MESRTNIKYAVVATTLTHQIISDYFADEKDRLFSEDFSKITQQILTSPNLTTNSKMSLVTAYGNWCFTLDSSRHLYVVLVALEYPSRLAFRFLRELKEEVERAIKRGESGFKPIIVGLAKKHDSLGELDAIERSRAYTQSFAAQENVSPQKPYPAESFQIPVDDQVREFYPNTRSHRLKILWMCFAVAILLYLIVSVIDFIA